MTDKNVIDPMIPPIRLDPVVEAERRGYQRGYRRGVQDACGKCGVSVGAYRLILNDLLGDDPDQGQRIYDQLGRLVPRKDGE